uniref:Uncharacterized protein n=1 Tax=Magallana gigas TaxID=29159 RepID=A0A8W8MJL4_MAGGI
MKDSEVADHCCRGFEQFRNGKKHVLRTVNQNDARKDIRESLRDHEILLERDWAMKFIPMQYRESQSNWFGKRGLSWHITVGTFRNEKHNSQPLFAISTLQHKIPTLLMQSLRTA